MLMMRSTGRGGATAKEMAAYHASRKVKTPAGEDGGVYTAEMGEPPQDIDMGSAPKPKAKRFANGGVTRADGCVRKGHTKGKMR